MRRRAVCCLALAAALSTSLQGCCFGLAGGDTQDCAAILLDHGKVPETAFSATALVDCDEGYGYSGPTILVCIWYGQTCRMARNKPVCRNDFGFGLPGTSLTVWPSNAQPRWVSDGQLHPQDIGADNFTKISGSSGQMRLQNVEAGNFSRRSSGSTGQGKGRGKGRGPNPTRRLDGSSANLLHDGAAHLPRVLGKDDLACRPVRRQATTDAPSRPTMSSALSPSSTSLAPSLAPVVATTVSA